MTRPLGNNSAVGCVIYLGHLSSVGSAVCKCPKCRLVVSCITNLLGCLLVLMPQYGFRTLQGTFDARSIVSGARFSYFLAVVEHTPKQGFSYQMDIMRKAVANLPHPDKRFVLNFDAQLSRHSGNDSPQITVV